MRCRPTTFALIPLLVSALILNPLTGTLAYAQESAPKTFADLVRNTKETDSILLKSEDLAEAENYYPSGDARTQTALENAFAAVAKSMDVQTDGREPSRCEPLILSRFKTEAAALGLRSDPVAFRYALLLLRKKNVIDDLALRPLLASYPAWAALGYSESDWVRRDAEGRTAIVECPTGQYLQIYGSLKGVHGRKFKRKHIRESISEAETPKNEKEPSRYLPVQIAWLRALEKSRFDQETEFTIGPVLENIAEAKDSSNRAAPNEAPTKIMSKRKKKTGGLSNRLSLYAKYSGRQINMLTDRYAVFVDRMDLFGSDVEIVYRYKTGRPDETIKPTQQEQYRLAARILHQEIADLKNSKNFEGKAPTLSDVIIACVETGQIHASELDLALGIENVWNPEVSGWTKIMNFVKKYGTTVFVLIPSTYTFMATLLLTLAETLVQEKTKGPPDGDTIGTSIF